MVEAGCIHSWRRPSSINSQTPSLEEFGREIFEVKLPKDDKSQWMFSNPLKKLFIKAQAKIRLELRISDVTRDYCYVRALPVYITQDDICEAVVACIQHADTWESECRYHVLRCNSNWCKYDNDIRSGRRSCRILFSSADEGSVTSEFWFVCSTACPTGMKRRPIAVIFTLEDNRGTVMARRVLHVRVCTGIKRDMRKEEKALEVVYNTSAVSPKRPNKKLLSARTPFKLPRRTYSADSRHYTFELREVNTANYEFVLHFLHSYFLGHRARGKSNLDVFVKKVESLLAAAK